MFIVFSISFYFFITGKRDTVDSQIEEVGVYCVGIIKSDVISKGSVRAFKFTFSINGVNWQNRRNISLSYFKGHAVGDTILIKVLPSKLPESVIVEDKEYQSCFGVQPSVGWKELPKCN